MLSDARVKQLERDFEHGSDTLRRIEPRLFRYRQNWGDRQRDGSEAAPAYAGIIAQELPDELAPFCRFASRHRAPAAATCSASDAGAEAGAEAGADSARCQPLATTLAPATPSPATPSRAVTLPRLSDLAAAADAWPADDHADQPAGYHPAAEHGADDARRGARLQSVHSLRAAGGPRAHDQRGARLAERAAAAGAADATAGEAAEAAEAAGAGSWPGAEVGAGSSAWLYQTPMLHEVRRRPPLPTHPTHPTHPPHHTPSL